MTTWLRSDTALILILVAYAVAWVASCWILGRPVAEVLDARWRRRARLRTASRPPKGGPMTVGLDMIWECPVCGAQVGQAPYVTIHPSKCAFGHPPTEMEQRSAERWGRQYEESDGA